MIFEIPAKTKQDQALASHPQRSAWVSANAGSGKTFVLSQRVIRLLLAGTDPSRILCLTFTKAAAAEMSNRVFARLSDWIGLDDDALGTALQELEGRPPKTEELALARRLFARALETPGGLKIQTIHAFAERLLHQFPLEANVPAHFEILDDQLAADLLNNAIGFVLSCALRKEQPLWSEALAHLVGSMGDMDIRNALASLVRNREGFGRFMEMGEATSEASSLDEGDSLGVSAALQALAAYLGVDEQDNFEAIRHDLAASPHFPPDYVHSLADLFATGGKRDKDQAILLRHFLEAEDPDEKAGHWWAFLRKKDGFAKSDSYMASKKVREGDAALAGCLDREQARLDALEERRKALVTLAGSRALFILADGVISHYERAKAARGLMDFDDLIIKAANLLAPSQAAAWVHYKLDQGIDHILVDEAQDTNPRQWEIIQQLGEEFFVSESARSVERTIFAVGDEKQSIYSFQGAEPKWFAQMRDLFARRAGMQGKPFHKIDLQLSFRSTPHILKAVDEVFANEAQYAALSADHEPTVHEAIRRKDPGLVELWPLLQPVEQEMDEDWAAPLDAQGDRDPGVTLARMIADTIKHWLTNGDYLAGSGKRITAGDILVLVRKRGAFVHAVNRALKEAGLPVAGADRLALLDHIAVMDLLSLGDVMLLPEDDLSLACLLKSPLFNLCEEDLFELAKPPEPGGIRDKSLWEILGAHHQADASSPFGRIFATLSAWRAQIDFQPPFDFYAQILGPGGKRKAFIERLGPEADEVIDELLSRALDFEKKQIPNLQAFLAAMRQGGAEIKRDMGAADNQIRVMTVHGSKGLEAPIVFMVDSTGKPSNPRHHPHLVSLSQEDSPVDLMALKTAKVDQPAKIQASLSDLDRETEEEYLRLLYVGMTRAEDRLYLCGFTGARGPAENCWYNVVANQLRPNAQKTDHPVTGDEILRWQLQQDFTPRPLDERLTLAPVSSPASLPDWLRTPLESEPAANALLQPSKAADLIEAKSVAFAQPFAGSNSPHPASPALHDWEPRWRGSLLHSLFEHLPTLPSDQWQARGQAFLARIAKDMSSDSRADLLDEALLLLNDSAFAALFGPDSQAEVSLAGWVETKDGPRDVSGQVDRLVITPNDVIVIDYKTNRQVPASTEDVPFDYISQMALYGRLLAPLYPKHSIRTLLLWSCGPSLMEIEPDVRQAALAQIGIR
ncbi:MAG: double-strand break repair helicase AddA [Cohaesibacter sp.]|nr:double-strand break repair helicase AddA [Cohaesibacter sp.]